MDGDGFAEDLRVLAKDMVIHHTFVGVNIDIGKYQPGDHANDQRDGELLQNADVMGSQQCTTLYLIRFGTGESRTARSRSASRLPQTAIRGKCSGDYITGARAAAVVAPAS